MVAHRATAVVVSSVGAGVGGTHDRTSNGVTPRLP